MSLSNESWDLPEELLQHAIVGQNLGPATTLRGALGEATSLVAFVRHFG